MQDFLPVTREDMKSKGWDTVDFVYVTGDAYVDHPSFGSAIIGRLLESRGYRVGTVSYTHLDVYKRQGYAESKITPQLMPTEERGAIGMIKPTGWHTVKYDNVDGRYLYNRCHLIGYQLTGENANEKNLITGTRYLNVTGMLPFENEVADYVHSTGCLLYTSN